MRYFVTEIDFEEEHMTQIASNALHLLKANTDKYEFKDFVEENDIDEEQMKFFGFKKINGYYVDEEGDDDEEYDDDDADCWCRSDFK